MMADENLLAEQCHQELDTRDSMAALARRRADTTNASDSPREKTSAFEDTATTQILPPSFIPPARSVTGTFQQVSSGSSARSAAATLSADRNQTSRGITPRAASSAPHYAD